MKRHMLIGLGFVSALALGVATQVSREEFDALAKKLSILEQNVSALRIDVDRFKSSRAESGLPRDAKGQKAGAVLGAWEGTGIEATKAFQARSPWRIEWTASGDGFLSVRVCEAGGASSSDLVVNEMTTRNPKKGETYIHASGAFYLKIEGFDSKWSVRAIQEAAETPAVP